MKLILPISILTFISRINTASNGSIARQILSESIMSEGGIGKSVLRFIFWHHEACGVMTNGESEGQTFLSHPHTKMYLFSCSHLNSAFLFIKSGRRLIT